MGSLYSRLARADPDEVAERRLDHEAERHESVSLELESALHTDDNHDDRNKLETLESYLCAAVRDVNMRLSALEHQNRVIIMQSMLEASGHDMDAVYKRLVSPSILHAPPTDTFARHDLDGWSAMIVRHFIHADCHHDRMSLFKTARIVSRTPTNDLLDVWCRMVSNGVDTTQ